MHILWVGKEPGEGAAGDEIYDRKIIAAAEEAGARITRFYPGKISRTARVANVVRGIAHYRNLYDSDANRSALRKVAAGFDIAICSWEPFDRLAAALPCPVIPILHNVTSAALPAMLPRSVLARLPAAQASRWEKAAYANGQFPVIAVLSKDDQAHISQLRSPATVLYAPPGMPEPIPLDPAAMFKAEILISGTFDWYPKRRDMISFAREYSALSHQLPVLADALPIQASRMLSTRPMLSNFKDAIRVGLIPDRFTAGHKLKATFYIANNAVVLSYANIASEFADIEDHDFFIRKLENATDIERHVAELGAFSSDVLVQRMEDFKKRCAKRFSWSASTSVLLGAAVEWKRESTATR